MTCPGERELYCIANGVWKENIFKIRKETFRQYEMESRAEND